MPFLCCIVVRRTRRDLRGNTLECVVLCVRSPCASGSKGQVVVSWACIAAVAIDIDTAWWGFLTKGWHDYVFFPVRNMFEVCQSLCSRDVGVVAVVVVVVVGCEVLDGSFVVVV